MSQKSQQKEVDVDRLTLIYDDDDTEFIPGGCTVRYTNNGPEILLRAQYVPREHIGMEVVAAHQDGTVEEAFEVSEFDRQKSYRIWR